MDLNNISDENTMRIILYKKHIGCKMLKIYHYYSIRQGNINALELKTVQQYGYGS